MKNIKVSVALCTYNGEKYIKYQLLSILEQSKKVDEIIISDDNSNDNTIKIAEKILKNYNVNYKILVNKKNIGVVKNFEQAIKACSGDIIFLSDQDDIWVKDKVSIILNEFINNRNCIMAFSDAELVNENGKSLNVNLWNTLNFSVNCLEKVDLLDVLLNRCVVTGATMAFRKELFQQCVPFSKWWIHDGWLALHAVVYGDVKAIDIPLIKYRQHSSNVIGASKLSSFKRIKKYFNNIKILKENRIERYRRYKDFLIANDKINNKIKDKILNCVIYWEEMVELDKKGSLEQLKTMFKHYFNGNYNKYYTGLRGFLRDIASIWVT